MKSTLCTFAYCVLILFVIPACNKADKTDPAVVETGSESGNGTNHTNTTSNQCTNAPNYGDSILYLQPVNGNYTVEPVNNKGVQGTYLAWPEGLVINATTGVINITQSETGIRYNVAFVKKGTTDTCKSTLILGGVSYIDSIYVLSKNDTLAAPVFNANPNASPVCDGSDDTDYPDNGNHNGNNKCQFDNDTSSQGANKQKLRVRTISGIINLKKSLEDGLLGKNPKNGHFKKVKIEYRLNDNSKKADQKITVQVMYYDKVSNIPNDLKQDVATKRKNAFTYSIIAEKPRPPLLIIAGLAN